MVKFCGGDLIFASEIQGADATQARVDEVVSFLVQSP